MPTIGEMFPGKYLKAIEDIPADAKVTDVITDIESVELKTANGTTETKWVLFFEQLEKGLVLNVTNARTLARAYGEHTEDWIGREVDLVVRVTCWPDGDGTGRQHMAKIAARLRALGISCRLLDPWPDASDGRDAADFTDTTDELEALLATATEPDDATPTGPWARAVTAAAFVAQQDDVLEWLEPRLLAPGSVTQWYSPRGLGKTQAALALAVKLARRGHRVLLLDRDNSKRELRRRLRGWGPRTWCGSR